MNQIMKTQNAIMLAAGLLAFGASAQSLRLTNVGPGIYCHFSPNCQVSPTVQSDSFTATNTAVTCTLLSRSFQGTGVGVTGQYGYEYQITLNNNGNDTSVSNIVNVDSLTLNFSTPQVFAFGGHDSNDVWILVSGGPVGPAPGSGELADNKVTFHFDPPITLNTGTDQATNTCYFGMISGSSPETTTATLTGTVLVSTNNTMPFKTTVQTQTP